MMDGSVSSTENITGKSAKDNYDFYAELLIKKYTNSVKINVKM